MRKALCASRFAGRGELNGAELAGRFRRGALRRRLRQGGLRAGETARGDEEGDEGKEVFHEAVIVSLPRLLPSGHVRRTCRFRSEPHAFQRSR